MTSKNSATLSLPKSRTVRGYEIRKMPIGAFLEACSLLEELPGTALRLLFPAVHDLAGGGGSRRIAICEKRCYDTGVGEQLHEHQQSD